MKPELDWGKKSSLKRSIAFLEKVLCDAKNWTLYSKIEPNEFIVVINLIDLIICTSMPKNRDFTKVFFFFYENKQSGGFLL